MRIDLILPQFVLLDVMYVLAACMQTIHVPLVVSRRMSYNRVADRVRDQVPPTHAPTTRRPR